ncbi:MAG: hypothetical protein K2W95_18415 [Candidatus Obscuribacterales bacterium]|nr:hypothetical protein [Candidatus Obscuribacterales bacterium]
MLSAYRAYNFAGCGAMASVVYLAIASALFGISLNNSAFLFYAWGLVSVLMVFVSAYCKFNRLPAYLHTILLVLVPAAAQFLPDSTSTAYSRFIVGAVVASFFLSILFYFCGKATDGKGNFILQELEDLLLTPWAVGLMSLVLLPAGLMLGLAVVLSQFTID